MPPTPPTPPSKPRNVGSDPSPPVPERIGPDERYGLIVAPGTHKEKRLDLPAVSRDARALRELLVDPDCGMFKEQHVEVLQGADATLPNIRRGLSKLARRAGANGFAFLAFLGHAEIQDQEIYFLTHETECNDLHNTALSKHVLKGDMALFRTKYLFVVLDCCHAGQFDGLLPTRHRAVLSGQDLLRKFEGEGQVILAAAGHDQMAEEGERGFLSLALEEGLSGKADTDRTGVVTLNDLGKYVDARVGEMGRQKPRLIGSFTPGFVLTLNRELVRDRQQRDLRVAQAREDVTRWGNINHHGSTGLEGHEVKAIFTALDDYRNGVEQDLTAKCLIESIFARIGEATCPATVKILAFHLYHDNEQGRRDELINQLQAEKKQAGLLAQSCANNKEEIARLTAEKENLGRTLQQAEQAQGEAQHEAARLDYQLRQTLEALDQAKTHGAALQDEATQAAQRLAELQAQVAQLEPEFQKQVGELAKTRQRARAATTWAWLLAGFATVSCLILLLAWWGGYLRGREVPPDPNLVAEVERLQDEKTRLEQQLIANSNLVTRLTGEVEDGKRRQSNEAQQSLQQIKELNDQIEKLRKGPETAKAEAEAKAEADELKRKISELEAENSILQKKLSSLPAPPPPKTTPPPRMAPLNLPPPKPGRPFTNTLEMRFVPLAGDLQSPVLISIWETRVQDYREFFHQKRPGDSDRRWESPSWWNKNLPCGPGDAVSFVNWEDAREYAEWLTNRERNESPKLLSANQRYRLPTEKEWEAAATRVLPKGPQGWQSPPESGNFGDESWHNFFDTFASRPLPMYNYQDGFPSIAPVGSFPKLPTDGVYDLWGNLWEWCATDTNLTMRVARGGSWQTTDAKTLQPSAKVQFSTKTRSAEVGFRLVLDLGPVKAQR